MNTTPPPGTTTQSGPPPPPPPPPSRPPWRFVRRERGRLIAGVTTGMAEAFGVDVVVMRVIWVVVAVASFGLGVAAYAICWIAFPSDEHPAPMTYLRDHDGIRHYNVAFIAGLALLGLGLLIVFDAAVPPFRHGGGVAWAAVLIGAGLAVLFLRHPDRDHDVHEVGVDAPPAAAASTPPNPPAPPSTAWTQHAPWPTPPSYPRHPRRRSFLTPLTISLLLVGAGVVTLLDNAGTNITIAEALAGGVLLTGVALVVSAWFGRAHGLIPVGILLLIVAVPATAIDVPLRGGVGHAEYLPLTRAELQYPYELGIGRLQLDLRSVPLAHQTTYLAVKVGIGEIVVYVPSNVRVVVHAHAGAGSVRLFGGNESGWPEDVTRTAPGTERGGRLDLVVRVGAGDVHIRRFDADGVETLLAEGVR